MGTTVQGKIQQERGEAIVIRAGTDIGGTFTDVIVFDPKTSHIRLAKVLSSSELERAVLDGIQKTGVSLDKIETLVHGTTVVINTLLERTGARTALVTTEGFRDVYEIGRINRPDSFNLFFKKHQPLVPRSLRFEVTERVLPEGELEPLDLESVEEVVKCLNAEEVEAVAILLLHSYVDPQHEQQLSSILSQRLPNCFVTASHELTREYREFERTSTVASNAYVGPRVTEYVGNLDSQLDEQNFSGHFYLMQSNGGLVGSGEARRNCISLVESGPAGGVIGSQAVLKDAGLKSGVAFDMGGTTAKAGVIEDGVPRIAHQYFAGSYGTGHPILSAVMDIHEVGTGGGSVASATDLGELRVGPRSAGASPGPAAYGLGGMRATVTDANVVLGRLSHLLPLAGGLELNLEAAKKAISSDVAVPLGIGVEEAAEGIVRVANTSMAYAISAVTVERGLNPAEFSLVAYGGAGPLHATQLARELGMGSVLIPPNSGVFSAYGMLFADPKGYSSLTRILPLVVDSFPVVKDAFKEMIVESAGRIGCVESEVDSVEFFADMRYVGQEHAVTVPVAFEHIENSSVDTIKSTFDSVHEQIYSHSAEEEPAEIVTLRVVSTKASRKPEFSPLPKRSNPLSPQSYGDVYFSDGFTQEVPFFDRKDLCPEDLVNGPCVISETTTSTVLFENDDCLVHPNGHLMITVSGV